MSANEDIQYAIYIKNAKKSYGEKKVLNNFFMKVPRGCIYSLLGASGCGKTTLLNCVLGLKTIDSGDIYVLSGAHIIGYMPQEIALVAEFTVRDAVYYFGRISKMNDRLIEDRFQTLKKLLNLPPDERQLKNCSGGQQRRVSFAAALVHKPQLLILDEPTVGLDPVLRANIWNHLVEIAEKEQTTIIITTHYIEEARQAHKIGLMREGELLAEESPKRLLQLFNTETLEEVFLILSKQQSEGLHSHALRDLANSCVTTLSLEASRSNLLSLTQNKQYNTNAFGLSKHHLRSLLSKNTKQFLRNYGGMAFTFIYPILQLLPFLLAVGRDPHDLKLSIVNDNVEFKHCANYTKNGTAIARSFGNCHFTNLACRFLNEIEKPMFDIEYYDNLNDAFEDMRRGKVIGVLHMAHNYSDAYSNRVNYGSKVLDQDLDPSEVKVWLDMSRRQTSEMVKVRLFRQFQNFQASALADCNYFDKFGRIPLHFTFEYGTEEEEQTESMLPGMLLTLMCFLGATLTSSIIVIERQEGMWDRSIVAGVSAQEIVVTHFAIQFILVVIQTSELIVLTFMIYDYNYQGDMYLIFLFVLLQGLAGMVLGLCISVVSKNLITAAIACSGSFVPMVLLCGVFWPLEGQSESLRKISICLPFTIPIASLRYVLKKGYGLDEWQVLKGLSVNILWIFILSIIIVFIIKARR